jgi:hypothetical protein
MSQSKSKNPVTEFTIKLDGIEIPEKLHAAINADLQNVVLKHVATLDYGKNPEHIILDRRYWYGIWLKRIAIEQFREKLQRPDIAPIREIFSDFIK